MKTHLNKSTKARLKRVAQSADKAADFLTRAHGDTYNLPEYSAMIEEALRAVINIRAKADHEVRPAPPPTDEAQTDIEQFTGGLDAPRAKRGQ